MQGGVIRALLSVEFRSRKLAELASYSCDSKFSFTVGTATYRVNSSLNPPPTPPSGKMGEGHGLDSSPGPFLFQKPLVKSSYGFSRVFLGFLLFKKRVFYIRSCGFLRVFGGVLVWQQQQQNDLETQLGQTISTTRTTRTNNG